MPTKSDQSTARLLSPGEVASMLYVHPRTVTRWAGSGKITSVLTPGGHRRFALSEVLRLMAGTGTSGDGATTYAQVIGAAAMDVAACEAALTATRAAAAAVAAEVLTADAAVRARRSRQSAARDADEIVATEAGRNVIEARRRSDIAAARVHEAAVAAARVAHERAHPDDPAAVALASETALIVEQAAALVAAETKALADSVAVDVATTAELIAANRIASEAVIEAEVEATAAALAALTAEAAREADLSAADAHEHLEELQLTTPKTTAEATPDA
ncbi:helix-turn-helix domain-containing protein [Nocardioides conyzicola]|uniref:Helix-turn-helix domain-containing protein n=1 Tax=Nocardioides conyzicola TaxID=1651781 RepID=A0ABP8WRT7_9ACTN